jgi:hypothetical protein
LIAILVSGWMPGMTGRFICQLQPSEVVIVKSMRGRNKVMRLVERSGENADFVSRWTREGKGAATVSAKSAFYSRR